MEFTVERPLRSYESVVILHPDIPEADAKKFFKRHVETIQKFAGKLHHIDTWGKRRLANPINKLKLGQYFYTTFEAKAGCVAELERLMRIDERVLRFMHVHLDERTPLSQHLEKYRNTLAESHKREQEKEARAHARRAPAGFNPRPRKEFAEEDEENVEE